MSLSVALTHHFDGFDLDVAFEAGPGVTALFGRSGAGKTTIVNAVAGLLRPDKARITLNGAIFNDDATCLPPHKRRVGYVFQDARLFPHLSVEENLVYGAHRRGVGSDLVMAVIEALDLRPLLHRAPTTLSGGEMRRVALGRALASGPRILLMDEPLTGLDRARKADLMPYIARAVAGFGVPAIHVTHSNNEISFLADRTLSIAEGRLTGWSPPAPRILGRIIRAVPGQVEFDCGGFRHWLAGTGEVGELWAISLGQDYLVTSEPPGASNAALVVEARVVRSSPGARELHADIVGQELALKWRRSDGAVPEEGSRIWLCLPHLAARPVQGDAAGDDSI